MDRAAKIEGQKDFDVSDFALRWRKARIAALKKCLGARTGSQVHENTDVFEHELMLEVKSDQRDRALRAVFDHSRQLGLSVVRHLGLCWEVSDLAAILPQLGSPCFSGAWRLHNEAHVLRRTECGELADLGHFACDYWREALDGLVVGVGEDERLARHRSRGHGDAECMDVLFVERSTPPRIVASETPSTVLHSPKYGPISPQVAAALEPVCERFQKMKVRLVLEGVSEGVLYYRLDADEGVLCGAGGKLLHDSFVREFENLCPGLKARDAAPLAVYGGAT